MDTKGNAVGQWCELFQSTPHAVNPMRDHHWFTDEELKQQEEYMRTSIEPCPEDVMWARHAALLRQVKANQELSDFLIFADHTLFVVEVNYIEEWNV